MTPPGVSVRPAAASDQTLIRQWVRDARLDPTSLRWPQFVIAEIDGEVVGIGQVRPAAPELGSLVVRPDRRGEGIGGALIRALLARHPGDMYLECRPALVDYYTRFGFDRIPWHAAPWPLKLKAGLGNLLGAALGISPAVMVRRATDEPD